LRYQALKPPLATFLALALLLSVNLACLVLPLDAAEVLQVAGADRLIIGDRNRSAEVILGCMAVTPGSELEATTWLRQRLPRRSRVNLRPVGEHDNRLIARISLVNGAETGDLSDGLITAGLASSTSCSS
jgi:hypothetical protein